MRTRILCGVGVALSAVVAFGIPDVSWGQPPAHSPTNSSPGSASAARFLLHADPAQCGGLGSSIAGCERCHAQKNATDSKTPDRYHSDQFILLNESITWFEKDIHSAAYQNLSGPIGQQMARVLGYDVTKDARCLTCHSADTQPVQPLAEKKYEQFATADGGINCTVCHGLGRDWQNSHFDTPRQAGDPMPWRAKDPAYKYSKGMSDLRNPATKAKLCVSCHVGNPDEGKIITHEMYAAGHPPLPPFELGTFMENEPKHWGYPTDKRLKFFEEFAQKEPTKNWPIFRFHPAQKESYLARHVANGAIAALQAEMRTVAAEAQAAADPNGTTMVDYARFDCYACHHDLKYPSDRQKRGYSGPPGRPTLKAWVEALPGVVAKHAEGLNHPELKELAPAFAVKWEAVQKAAVARPFGAPAPLAAAANDLAEWCEQFLLAQTQIATPVYTPEETARLQQLVVEAATGRWAADPEAAMHLTWAYVTLRSDGQPAIPKEQLDQLDAVLATQVRYPHDYMNPTTKRPKPVQDYLKPRLRKFGQYEADKLRQALRAIAPHAGSN
ncbi:MAG: cytochrome c family protein [Bacteroidales bacterium]|nr:cytochrome c family protein [Bacteroidales bacterium]